MIEKEKRKPTTGKSATTSTKEKVAGLRPLEKSKVGFSEANQKSCRIRAARLKQQEIFIPQWPELAITD